MTLREWITAAVLAIIGVALVWSWTIRPASDVLAARAWQPARCTVASSEVRPGTTSDSAEVWHLDVAFTWEAGGRAHRSDRWAIVPQTFGNPSAARERRDALPAGAEVPCWVDPGDPASAVLDRSGDWSFAMGWLGLLTLIPLFGPLFRSPAPGAVEVDTRRSAVALLALSVGLALLTAALFAITTLAGGPWGWFGALVVGLAAIPTVGMWGIVVLAVARLSATRLTLQVPALIAGQTVDLTWRAARPIEELSLALVGYAVDDGGDATVRTELSRSPIADIRPGRASGAASFVVPDPPARATAWEIEIRATDSRRRRIQQAFAVPRPTAHETYVGGDELP